jgi:hypothetical protein
MKKLIKALFSWSHTPAGDAIVGALLFLAVFVLLVSTPLWV